VQLSISGVHSMRVSVWPLLSQMPAVPESMQRRAPGVQMLQAPVCALQAAGEPQSMTVSKAVSVGLHTCNTEPSQRS
jgi:hypothetical protein